MSSTRQPCLRQGIIVSAFVSCVLGTRNGESVSWKHPVGNRVVPDLHAAVQITGGCRVGERNSPRPEAGGRKKKCEILKKVSRVVFVIAVSRVAGVGLCLRACYRCRLRPPVDRGLRPQLRCDQGRRGACKPAVVSRNVLNVAPGTLSFFMMTVVV